ncbi:MAG: type II secretion system GspH family protein [Lachnospiraceae bacterium]|nr:type II secretion system GspH family protein [Lachnospiraceae bacterium]
MRRRQWRDDNRNKGYTLVELVVSMALTAILATAVASIMFPVVSIFMDMQKLSRAQMVADMVTDALRNECAKAYVTGAADVRILELQDPADFTTGDEGLRVSLGGSAETIVGDISSPKGGNVLAFRVNEGYAEAIYWNTGISTANYSTLLEEEAKTGIVTSKAVFRLFPRGVEGMTKENMPADTRHGYLHCAYYVTSEQNASAEDGKNIKVFCPEEAYDYTNPFSANAYNGFTVQVEYSPLEYEKTDKTSTSTADLRPVYVVATVKVYQGDYAAQSGETLACTRRAVLCFAEDNKY